MLNVSMCDFITFSRGTRVALTVISATEDLTHVMSVKDLTRRSTALLITPRSSDQKVMDSVVVLDAFKAKTIAMGN